MIGNPSNKDDAICHRERKSANKVFAFQEKKLYLGLDTRQKLALIAQQLTGSRLNTDKFDAERAADVLSACVNHMFNGLLNRNGGEGVYGLEDCPAIEAAMSPKALKVYTTYQLVKGRFDKLNTGDSDNQKCESVAATLNECEVWKPPYKILSKSKHWTLEDVAWVLHTENINEKIKFHNRKHFDPKDHSKKEADIATLVKNI